MSGKKNIFLVFLITVFIVFAAVNMVRERGAGAENTGICYVNFSKNSADISDPTMAILEDDVVVLGKQGDYHLSGDGENISVKVSTKDTGLIRLYLDSLSLKHETYSPFVVANAGQVELILDGDSSLSDGSDYVYDAGDTIMPKACFYSKKGIDVKGDGSLSINGNYQHGMSVRGNLTIESGSIDIASADNGIDSNSQVNLIGGDITINALQDGINVKDDADATAGKVTVAGSHLEINAGDEGIQAAGSIDVRSGRVKIKSTGLIFKTDGELTVNSKVVEAVNANE